MKAHTNAAARSHARIPFRVVGLAASAGGLKALREILSVVPPHFPAAVIVVQHLSPHHKSYLAEVLRTHTPLRVKQAEEGDHLHAGTVFVAPPDKHVVVNPDGTLSLSHTGRVHHVRPSADVLFASMAISCQDRAIGVVLTGCDDDGSAGVKLIKAMGGTVIAQDETTAENCSMPRAAIATGAVDYILPLPQIASLVEYLASNPNNHVPHRRKRSHTDRRAECTNTTGCPKRMANKDIQTARQEDGQHSPRTL